MKIYYNDDIATEMQRMFNNGFGIIINANDVTMTQVKINYIKGRQTVYYIGVKLIDDPIEFNLYDELYGATNENTKSICYYTSTNLSYKNIILDILYLSSPMQIELKDKSTKKIIISYDISNRDYLPIPSSYPVNDDVLICISSSIPLSFKINFIHWYIIK